MWKTGEQRCPGSRHKKAALPVRELPAGRCRGSVCYTPAFFNMDSRGQNLVKED